MNEAFLEMKEQLSDNQHTSEGSRLSDKKKQHHRSPLSMSKALLESRGFSRLMVFLTIFVLVGDDIRLLGFEKEADVFFNVATIVSLVLFLVELTISSMVKDDYFLGFWFVLDSIATLSLVADITFISEAMMGYPEISIENVDGSSESGAIGQSEYARAARSSRVGARVARFIRVVRLIRISRITQCFNKVLFWRSNRELLVAPGESTYYDADEKEGRGAESRVGKKLSEKTTQRVFILVLVMLFGIPQLSVGDVTTYMPSSAQYGADVIYTAWVNYERAVLGLGTINTTEHNRLLRKEWETQMLMYIYYHNHHTVCPDSATSKQECADRWNYKLCFVGYVTEPREPDAIDNVHEGYLKELQPNMSNWDSMFSMGDWKQSTYIVGTIPAEIKEPLTRPWVTDCTESAAQISGVSLLQDMPCPRKTFRKMETMWYVPQVLNKAFFNKHVQSQFVFVFDIRTRISWQAFMSMMQTVFIVIVLGVAAFFFSQDTDSIVLLPIERMICKVEAIRKDPLFAIKLGHKRLEEQLANNSGSSDAMRDPQERKGRRRGKHNQDVKKKKASMETLILENMIIKLGSLLAVGFGEAGSEIIAKNLDMDDAQVEIMIPGSKVDAIYGFCAIPHFSTVTEVLQEKTMVFVNQVAHITHRIVDDHLGAANKNLGEAFLLVWRIGRYVHELRPKIADLAVMSVVQVVAELSRDCQLAEYREHPAILGRLHNFRVSLGFGLHLGWSIEGAIGSEFKIDASYLSPHVNIATLLQAESTEYSVNIIMSEPLVRFCNPLFRQHFRPVDHVKLQGLQTAMRIFTVDLDMDAIDVDTEERSRTKADAVSKAALRQKREMMKLAKLEPEFQVHLAFENDKNVKRMRERFTLEFLQEFEKGYMNYEAGEWSTAGEVLGRTLTMLSSSGDSSPRESERIVEDGPSRILFNYMAAHDFKAPLSWPGYRELASRIIQKDTESTLTQPRRQLSPQLTASSAPLPIILEPVPLPPTAETVTTAEAGGRNFRLSFSSEPGT